MADDVKPTEYETRGEGEERSCTVPAKPKGNTKPKGK